LKAVLDLLGLIPPWLGWVAPILVAIVTWFYLHEAERYSGKWWARTMVIGLTMLATGAGVAQSIRSGQFQASINALSRTVDAQQQTISYLRHHVIIAEHEQRSEQANLASEKTTIGQEQLRIRKVRELTDRLSQDSRQASRDAANAQLVSREVLAQTRKTNVITLQRMRKAEELSAQAALDAKRATVGAHVFRFAAEVSKNVTATLLGSGTGIADIACAPGLEAACSDLKQMFDVANWTPLMAYAAPFFAGFDKSEPNGGPALTIKYLPARQALANRLATIFESQGLTVGTLAETEQTPETSDISVLLHYITK
jgi:hypothetical protein